MPIKYSGRSNSEFVMATCWSLSWRVYNRFSRLFDTKLSGHDFSTFSWPTFGFLMKVGHFKMNAVQFKYHFPIKRIIVSSLATTSRSAETFGLEIQHCGSRAIAAFSSSKENLCKGQTIISEACFYYYDEDEEEEEEEESNEPSSAECGTEMLRRKRIGLANKGKIPWNKGITHNEATGQKIKQRTIAALSNIKVRMKMAECVRDRSEQCKEKISVSLRHVWAKRLNYPCQREKFFLSWFESIAKEAKIGDENQKELEWDCYDRMIEEMTLQKQQQSLRETKAKVNPMSSSKRNKSNKADMVLAQMQTGNVPERKEHTKKKLKRKKCDKLVNGKETAASDERKLLAKLAKIRRKKPAKITINIGRQSSLAWGKLDLEYIKKENGQKVSLADQIRAAKNRRQMLMSGENSEVHSLVSKS